MKQKNIEIITLPPFKAVSFYGFGENPEDIAYQAVSQWLTKHNLYAENKFRSFGFNNPDPSQGSPNYGYEAWIVPTEDFSADTENKIIEYQGGLYATIYCPSLDVIGQRWQELVNWRESSGYYHASHQWLEELHTPWEKTKTNLDFTLYLPIKK